MSDHVASRGKANQKPDETSLALFRALLDNSNDSIEVIEPGTLRFLDVNDTACRELGYSRAELLSMSVYDIDTTSEQENRILEDQIKKSGTARFERLHRRKDGSVFPVEISVRLIELDKPYLLSIARDISERRRAEDLLRRTNRALKLLGRCNTALIHAENEDEFLENICKLAVGTGGYRMAWIGYIEHNAAKTVRPVAQSGYEEGYLDGIDITWGDTERGRGPVGTAIRTKETAISPNCLTDPKMTPWRESAVKHGYQSIISLPIFNGNLLLGALNIYAAEPDSFSDEEVALLEDLAAELSYGIESLRTRLAHEQHTAVLRNSLEQSIQAIADTVEARDPYTAGHQRTVADLAVAIAREMELTEDQIHGIRLAAIIHDLGKIHIPVEILAKPGKLTDIEYQMIRTHPQAGYDIIKGIEFPWPIAEMIRQHHEKLDGSGYPQGLRGEQILPESRIIAVADVVEAMSSHRPYRAGLGLEMALEEIERHRNTHYDAQVVDACIRLFRKRGYSLPVAPAPSQA